MNKNDFDLCRKEKGSIMKMLPVLLAMAVVAVMTTMYFSYMSVSDVREKTDQIARKYILQMETTGYLSDTEKNNLISELNDIGLVNIYLADTTLTGSEYGSEIKLNIWATYVTYEVTFERFLFPQKKQQIYTINISKKSTAKC